MALFRYTTIYSGGISRSKGANAAMGHPLSMAHKVRSRPYKDSTLRQACLRLQSERTRTSRRGRIFLKTPQPISMEPTFYPSYSKQ